MADHVRRSKLGPSASQVITDDQISSLQHMVAALVAAKASAAAETEAPTSNPREVMERKRAEAHASLDKLIDRCQEWGDFTPESFSDLICRNEAEYVGLLTVREKVSSISKETLRKIASVADKVVPGDTPVRGIVCRLKKHPK